MGLPEIVEIWVRSLQAIFESGGVEVVCQRSPPERPNPSVALNMRRGVTEVDLLVWQSGHADLSTMSAQGSVVQKHFENVNTVEAIGDVLAVLSDIMLIPN